MLLNQQPITAETSKLVELIGGYGLKIRLLNVKVGGGDGDEDEKGVVEDGDKRGSDGARRERRGRKGGVMRGVGLMVKEPVLPSREGLDEDYYYDIGAM